MRAIVIGVLLGSNWAATGAAPRPRVERDQGRRDIPSRRVPLAPGIPSTGSQRDNDLLTLDPISKSPPVRTNVPIPLVPTSRLLEFGPIDDFSKTLTEADFELPVDPEFLFLYPDGAEYEREYGERFRSEDARIRNSFLEKVRNVFGASARVLEDGSSDTIRGALEGSRGNLVVLAAYLPAEASIGARTITLGSGGTARDHELRWAATLMKKPCFTVTSFHFGLKPDAASWENVFKICEAALLRAKRIGNCSVSEFRSFLQEVYESRPDQLVNLEWPMPAGDSVDFKIWWALLPPCPNLSKGDETSLAAAKSELRLGNHKAGLAALDRIGPLCDRHREVESVRQQLYELRARVENEAVRAARTRNGP